MAEIGTVLGAAQTLFAALECSILSEAISALGYKSELQDLKSTVKTVESVLLDAAASEELTNRARDYVEKLKIAVYDADDLFDEFRTLADRNQILKDSALSVKVRHFFSSENSLNVAFKMSRKIKSIRKDLDCIARDHTSFGFAVDSKPIRKRNQETCSYVNSPNVIGREADVEVIVDKLIGLNAGGGGARFVTVVGIGGLGKTTLAQLVCADERVKQEFSSRVWWVCVADQDKTQFDVKTILCNILDLASSSKDHGSTLEEVQKNFRRELEGKKYLIVLDDLWNDDKLKWMDLKEYLVLGAAESRIMVTTRSHDVAKIIGNGYVHVLEGLSDENSWRLFEVTAFEHGVLNPLEVEIGRKIVKQCSNVPLAIKVVGSLLSGQGLEKWKTFERSGLGGIRQGENQIMSILKFSYHNLEPSVKSCFTYCALFPKDFEIEKKMLIRLWMAQGYIVPFDRDQTIEEASEEHFLILLRRCFFQDVMMDEYGNVHSFKMHDLIHDVAQQVAGPEILVSASETRNLGDRVRHVFEGNCEREENFYSNVKIRSYVRADPKYLPVYHMRLPLDTIFTHGRCLRTLKLVSGNIKSLPADAIGKLLHLRYLDLSGNTELKTLPDSVTKLHNLQTLKLKGCGNLRELPKKLSRLVNLMHLNIDDCYNLRHMPVGMDKMTSLCELTNFVVVDESSSGVKRVGQLKDLKALVSLKGEIDICMDANVKNVMSYDSEGGFLEGARRLERLCITFHLMLGLSDGNVSSCDVCENDEAVLEKLLPHPNIKELKLEWYFGVKLPGRGWGDSLVQVHIERCPGLKRLPLLSKLKHMKSLAVEHMNELEYIEQEEEAESCILFPSLETLLIVGVPKLKGWWEGVEFADSSNNARLWQRSFPRLFKLQISRATQSFRDKSERGDDGGLSACVCTTVHLKSLPAERLNKIILVDDKVESLVEVEDVFKNCSSLRKLLLRCSKLRYLPRGLDHLTTLESLKIESCKNLKLEEEDDDDDDDHKYNIGMPWIQLGQNLRSLELVEIDSLKILPKGMQHLTSLQDLSIVYCRNLEELPEWISSLSSLHSLSLERNMKIKSIPQSIQNTTSLNRLQILSSSRQLMARCNGPEGEDWPKIKHIPTITIGRGLVDHVQQSSLDHN